MIAATAPVQRSPRAKVMVVDPSGQIRHLPRPALIELIQPGDLVVANDAATIPASLSGVHLPSDRPIEVRLAGVPSLDPHNREFSAVVFGEGDFHTRTEDRPRPPSLAAGDQLQMGPLSAKILHLLDHPRLILLEFDHSRDELWAGSSRPTYPVLACSGSSCPLGCVDTHRGAARCLRAAVRRLRAELATCHRDARRRRAI